MTNVEMLEEVSRALALLALQTAAENQAGLFSKNRMTEDLMLPLFRVIYEAPDLRNANDGMNNYPHVDLVAEQSKIAVQVTTERVASKVTGTLEGFLKDKLEKRYSRLIVFILTANPPQYQKPTRDTWKKLCGNRLAFEPARDILTPLSLLPLIQALPQASLESVHGLIGRSVLGKNFIDVESQLENFSRRSLRYEMDTGKYIPDVFIETDRTKQVVRTFCHPSLFFRRTMERYPQAGIEYWNEFLGKAGLNPLPIPDRSHLTGKHTLSATIEDALSIPSMFAATMLEVARYEEAENRKIPLTRIPAENRGFFEQNSWKLGWELGGGFLSSLNDFIKRASAAGKPICLLTGSAGQGKTNFVCDLVETFLLRHAIPCAYLSVRRLALQQGPSLGDRIIGLLFDQKILSFQDGAKRLSETAGRCNKPFVLILDGMNEHPNGPLFSRELEAFLHEFLAFPFLRILLTCRSEYFEQRFGNLKSFAEQTVNQRVFSRHFGLEERQDLITAYFDFFRVQPALVAQGVTERLQDDVLLLRFFCEAYGARGKEEAYVQPRINGIYRDEIFELYLEKKLNAIEDTAAMSGGNSYPGPRQSVRAVLATCLAFMLDQWRFTDVPMKIIPKGQMDALERLLDEELIVRRDAPNTSGFFALADETLNFTFDEFRDFLLAQFLVQSIFHSDRQKFEQYIKKSEPADTAATEGLKKFLFFIGRKRSDAKFHEYYKNQAWYAEVFQEEVFNLPGDLLNADDAKAVRERLLRYDAAAKQTAINLAIRWNRNNAPWLNLDLLIDVVGVGDEQTYRRLVQDVFSQTAYGHNGASASAFAIFIEDRILPTFQPEPSSPTESLFRFLVLLLPVDATYDLSSPTFLVLQKAMQQHTDYVVDVLLWSFQKHLIAHVPFVWRLLTQAEEIRHSESALKLAQSQVRDKLAPAVLLEIDRFLKVVSVRQAKVGTV